MNRYRRVASKGLTVLSLVLALLMYALWLRSYWCVDDFSYYGSDGIYSYVILTGNGALSVLVDHADGTWKPRRGGWGHDTFAPKDLEPLPHSCAGIGWDREDMTIYGAIVKFKLQIALAYLIALFLLLPVFRLYRVMHRIRLKMKGLCPSCGYDLRSSPVRCPECGTWRDGHEARDADQERVQFKPEG